jgi:putative restriction endonuclease
MRISSSRPASRRLTARSEEPRMQRSLPSWAFKRVTSSTKFVFTRRVLFQSAFGRRAYITSQVRVRLHQHAFRERVIVAYQSQCALCRLRHIELLDAAHIIPDCEEEGEPLITNGIALCKLHHAAYDSFILSVSPDYVIHIRQDVLDEHDGPVLQHGLKDLNGNRITLPRESRNWPDKDALRQRFGIFLSN